MTEVLQVPRQPDGQSYFQSSGLRRSAPSSSSLFLESSAPSTSPRPTASAPATPHAEHTSKAAAPPRSPSSIANDQENATHQPSMTKHTSETPSSQSNLDLDTDLNLPDYAGVQFSSERVETPPSSPAYGSDVAESTTTDTTISDSPLPTPTIADDTAIKQQPTRQVDFLSHDWRVEDNWSSWRNIVSDRRKYGETSRLENAAWRTWAKTTFDLRTINPEELNWMKDHDITWLYGPMTPAASYPVTHPKSEPSSRLSKSNSFINKKPILKKRSMSEVMLQKSISTSSLIRQAANQALFSSSRRARRSDASSEFSESKLPSEVPSRAEQDYFTSRSSSFCETPSEGHERRHIRFDDRVEQCIAIDCKDAEPDDDESEDERQFNHDGSSGSSDDEGGLMMKRRRRTKRPNTASKGSRSNSHNGRKIIETLPSTTLKYRTDSPDITEQAQHHTFGRSWNSSKLNPSSSQETLRPSNSASNFLLPEDDDDVDEIDSDSSWSFGAGNPKSSLGSSSRGRNGTPINRSRSNTPGPRDDDFTMEGMRRTGSGMFMPDDEDEAVATGLFGRVSETINTARDIAHVIWTVGWRS